MRAAQVVGMGQDVGGDDGVVACHACQHLETGRFIAQHVEQLDNDGRKRRQAFGQPGHILLQGGRVQHGVGPRCSSASSRAWQCGVGAVPKICCKRAWYGSMARAYTASLGGAVLTTATHSIPLTISCAIVSSVMLPPALSGTVVHLIGLTLFFGALARLGLRSAE